MVVASDNGEGDGPNAKLLPPRNQLSVRGIHYQLSDNLLAKPCPPHSQLHHSGESQLVSSELPGANSDPRCFVARHHLRRRLYQYGLL